MQQNNFQSNTISAFLGYLAAKVTWLFGWEIMLTVWPAAALISSVRLPLYVNADIPGKAITAIFLLITTLMPILLIKRNYSQIVKSIVCAYWISTIVMWSVKTVNFWNIVPIAACSVLGILIYNKYVSKKNFTKTIVKTETNVPATKQYLKSEERIYS